MDEEKPTISLGKIASAIIGIMILFNVKNILQWLEPVFEWFGDSLYGLYDFPQGMQTAIAFLTIVLIVVLFVKHFSK